MGEKVCSQNKSIWNYKVVVFDLDGTLYFQSNLRVKMALALLSYYLIHPFRIREAFIVKKFREAVERWDLIYGTLSEDDAWKAALEEFTKQRNIGELNRMQYAYVASRMHCSALKVEEIINLWMYKKPLLAIYQTRDTKILSLIEALRKSGIKVAVLSDYPVEEKLKALQVSVDGIYAATDEKILELKPSPKGLSIIMDDFECGKSELLMIGDRYSKDGMAAINAGCDYVILKRRRYSRNLKTAILGLN